MKKNNKSDFVRSHSSLTASEVVAKAKLARIKLNAKYVYNVRAYDKKMTTTKKSVHRLPKNTIISGIRQAAVLDNGVDAHIGSGKLGRVTLEERAAVLLRAVAAEIGLSKAVKILEEEREKVRVVIES